MAMKIEDKKAIVAEVAEVAGYLWKSPRKPCKLSPLILVVFL